jgi:hypothetical protein
VSNIFLKCLAIVCLPAMVVVSLPQSAGASSLYYQPELTPDLSSDILGLGVYTGPNLVARSSSSSDDESGLVLDTLAGLFPLGGVTSATKPDAVDMPSATGSAELDTYLGAVDDADSLAQAYAQSATSDYLYIAPTTLGVKSSALTGLSSSSTDAAGASIGDELAAPWGIEIAPSVAPANLSEDLLAGYVGAGGITGVDAATIAYIDSLGRANALPLASAFPGAPGVAGDGSTVSADALLATVGSKVETSGIAGSIQSAAEPAGVGIVLVALILFFIAFQRRTTRRVRVTR